MATVFPAILEKDFTAICNRLAVLSKMANLAHLDLADGIFVPEQSWRDSSQLAEITGDVSLDLHLMVDRPEKWIAAWAGEAVFRLTFHWESTYDARRTINLIREKNKEVGLALKLETPLDKISEVISGIDMVLLLSIEPGAQGRSFDEKVLSRIKNLRQTYPDLDIGVDGGINLETGKKAIQAGANMLVSGSFIWTSPNAGDAYESLRNLD